MPCNTLRKYLLIILRLFLIIFFTAAACPCYAQSGSISSSGATSSLSIKSLSLPASNRPIEVLVSLQLHEIEEIDDESETFQFSADLILQWKDPAQAFNPDEEGVTEKIYQGDYQVNEIAPSWYPQVVLANQAGSYEKKGVIMRVSPDGQSTLIESFNATAETDFNMRRYPFDSQNLVAVFKIHGFDSSEVVFKNGQEKTLDFPRPFKIPQWKMNSTSAAISDWLTPYYTGNGKSSTFQFIIKLQREPFFVIRLVVLPMLLIVILSWSVFWMEKSSLGDRINVSFVGILTAVAYQMVIADILPHISYMTLINAFLNISMLLMCGSVLVNLIVGYSDRHGNAKTGDLIDYRCRWLFPLSYFSMILIATIIAFVFF